jgi:hypothetical protein
MLISPKWDKKAVSSTKIAATPDNQLLARPNAGLKNTGKHLCLTNLSSCKPKTWSGIRFSVMVYPVLCFKSIQLLLPSTKQLVGNLGVTHSGTLPSCFPTLLCYRVHAALPAANTASPGFNRPKAALAAGSIPDIPLVLLQSCD